MIHLASYPIARAFTSICIGIILSAAAPVLYAAGANDVANLHFQDAAGQNVTIGSFKGASLVVNFWATWCAPCITDMPTLALIQKEYRDKNLKVITISEDDTPETGVNFFTSHAIEGLTPYFDKDHAAMTAFQARGLPTTLLIDKNGTLMKTIEGPVTEPTLKIQSFIDSLITIP